MPIGSPLGLTLPTVGQTAWGGPLNTVLQAVIDAVEAKVTPSGINVTADLELNGNDLTEAASLGFTAQTSAVATPLRLWVEGDDLYFTDGAGNQVRFTQGGSLTVTAAGGIGGEYVSSGASVTYTSATSTYALLTPAAVYATLASGPVELHDGSSSRSVTLRSPSGLTGSFTVTFPGGTPSATSLLQWDSTGQVTSTRTPSVDQLTGSNVLATSLTGTNSTSTYSRVTGQLTSVSFTQLSGTTRVSGDLRHDGTIDVRGTGSISLASGFYKRSTLQPRRIAGQSGVVIAGSRSAFTGGSIGAFQVGTINTDVFYDLGLQDGERVNRIVVWVAPTSAGGLTASFIATSGSVSAGEVICSKVALAGGALQALTLTGSAFYTTGGQTSATSVTALSGNYVYSVFVESYSDVGQVIRDVEVFTDVPGY